MTSDVTRRRLRTSAFFFLAAVIASGVFDIGTGTGSSATARVEGKTTGYPWKVVNFTNKPLTQVDFTKWDQTPDGVTTRPSRVTAASLVSGAKVDGYMSDAFDYGIFAGNRTFGSLCYDGTRWELPAQTTKYAKWRGVYIFDQDNGHGGVQLYATPEGAHDDRGLVYQGAC